MIAVFFAHRWITIFKYHRKFQSIIKTETPFDEENVEKAQQKVGHGWVYKIFVL